MSDDVTFAGIDWASMLHVACVVGDDGQVVDRFEFTHDAAAITDMIRRMKRVKGQRRSNRAGRRASRRSLDGFRLSCVRGSAAPGQGVAGTIWVGRQQR
jgi:hypothetical protein